MDKLDHYLDQVCRGIGGPRSLRQHVRQELREHLLKSGLAVQKAPEMLMIVTDLPRTASGKVQRFLLREQVRHKLAADPGAGSGGR